MYTMKTIAVLIVILAFLAIWCETRTILRSRAEMSLEEDRRAAFDELIEVMLNKRMTRQCYMEESGRCVSYYCDPSSGHCTYGYYSGISTTYSCHPGNGMCLEN